MAIGKAYHGLIILVLAVLVIVEGSLIYRSVRCDFPEPVMRWTLATNGQWQQVEPARWVKPDGCRP